MPPKKPLTFTQLRTKLKELKDNLHEDVRSVVDDLVERDLGFPDGADTNWRDDLVDDMADVIDDWYGEAVEDVRDALEDAKAKTAKAKAKAKKGGKR
jgi:hypothetical protein